MIKYPDIILYLDELLLLTRQVNYLVSRHHTLYISVIPVIWQVNYLVSRLHTLSGWALPVTLVNHYYLDELLLLTWTVNFPASRHTQGLLVLVHWLSHLHQNLYHIVLLSRTKSYKCY